jgi:hypothetical protein
VNRSGRRQTRIRARQRYGCFRPAAGAVATRIKLADLYELTGYMFEMASEWESADYWYGLADGVRGGC